MSANKENRAAGRKKAAMKGKENSSERNPLKTLSFHSNAEHYLAGSSQGSSRSLDTRYVTSRNHGEELDWGFMVFRDDRTKPVDKADRNEKINERKTENDKSKKTEKRTEKDQSNKEKRTENDQKHREKNTENHQKSKEKKTETCRCNKAVMTERDHSNKEKKTAIDQPDKENKTEKDLADNTTVNVTSENNENGILGLVRAVVLKNTPLVIITPKVEIYPTKKVKRSLKRPHARRLHATTSPPVSAKSCQFSIYSNNDIIVPIASVGEIFDPLSEAYMMENLDYLQHLEKKVVGEPQIRNASRSCLINWIINVNGTSGNPAVVQLASKYFDCYLSRASVTVDKLQVIAAACFWIATKLHGRFISGRRLVKYSGHAFIENELVAAERDILRELQFQALPVVLHDFVPYLAWCCDESRSGLVEAAAVFLCQCGVMTDKTLSEEFPSVVAAAAVKDALILLRLTASMPKLFACPIYKAAEKKATDLDSTCATLRDAVRVVASVGYEYKAPLFKFSGPPHYISNKIVRAVNYKDILQLDEKGKQIKKSI